MKEDSLPSSTEVKIESARLPYISILFFQSWLIFRNSLLRLFIVNTIEVTFGVGIIILATLVAKFAFFQTPMHGSTIIILIFVLVMVYIWIIFVSSMVVVADLLVIDSGGQLSFATIWRRGFKVIIPVLLVEVATTLLAMGGYFLFILPGVLFSFFFTFAVLEVIFANQSLWNAIKISYTLVRKYFWSVIGRMLIILGISILFIYTIDIVKIMLKTSSLTGVVAFLTFLQYIIQILLSWFTLAYNLTLYKQLKSLSPITEEKSIRWIGLVSLVGWIVGITFILFLAVILIRKYQTTSTITSITAPKENETLCLGQVYALHWKGPINLHRVSFTVYYPSDSIKSNQADFLKAAKSPSDGSWGVLASDEKKGVFQWKVGETNGGTGTPEGIGYRVVMNGFKTETGNDIVNATSNYFNIADCSSNKKNTRPATPLKEVEIIAPSINEKLCLGQNYTVRWQGTKKLYNTSFILYTPQSDLVYTPQPVTPNPQSKQLPDSFTWKVGETVEGPLLPQASGYYLSINGRTTPSGTDSISADGNTFSIADCSSLQSSEPLPIPTFKNEGGRITTQLDNQALCEGSSMNIQWSAAGAIRSADMNLIQDSTRKIDKLGIAMPYDKNAVYNSGSGSSYGWNVGYLADGTKAPVGKDYRLVLILHYDDEDYTLKTGAFSIKACK